MAKAKPTNDSLRDLLAISASAYGIGIVVANLNFFRYGYSTFDLVKIQYATAGFWFILVVLVGLVIYLFTYLAIAKFRSIGSRFNVTSKILSKCIDIVSVVAGIASVATLVGYFLYEIGLRLKVDFRWQQLLALATATFTAALLIDLEEIYSQRADRRTLAQILRELSDNMENLNILQIVFDRITSVGWGSLIIVGAVVSISQEIYGSIPAAAGGGKPTPVQVVFSSDKQDIATRLGLRSVDIEPQPRILLLTESSDSYIFLIDGLKPAIRFPKGSVEALVFSIDN